MTDKERTKRIMNSLHRRHQVAVEDWCFANNASIMGLFLRGSQNYNCDTESSDIDTIAVVMPSVRRILKEDSRISTTVEVCSGEYCDIKDIRSFFDNIKKQHSSYLEVVSTDFAILIHEGLDDFLEKNAERLASISQQRFFSCCLGMMNRKMKDFFTPTKGTQEFFDKHGFDNKNFMHILRLESLLHNRFIENKELSECLTSFKWEGIEKFQQESAGEKLSDYCKRLADESIARVELMKKEVEQRSGYKDIDEATIKDIDRFIYQTLYNSMEEFFYD